VAEDGKLGELLIRENVISASQLKTAVDFQKKVGGELRDILVKLGYVKESVLAEVMAASQNLGAATIEINATVVDIEALKILPRPLLEKHQVIPLNSDDPNTLVLAMSDPNNIAAIEEIQFLVRRMVEPAVAPKNAIRKALNQIDEFLAEARPKGPASTIPADKARAILQMPLERLIRAYIITQIERGALTADELIARAEKL
jgi:type IV pilus assembly protein PilB